MCKLFRNINRGQVTDSKFQMYITYNRLKQSALMSVHRVKNKNNAMFTTRLLYHLTDCLMYNNRENVHYLLYNDSEREHIQGLLYNDSERESVQRLLYRDSEKESVQCLLYNECERESVQCLLYNECERQSVKCLLYNECQR